MLNLCQTLLYEAQMGCVPKKILYFVCSTSAPLVYVRKPNQIVLQHRCVPFRNRSFIVIKNHIGITTNIERTQNKKVKVYMCSFLYSEYMTPVSYRTNP